ncbi:MAG: ATP-binding protein [Leptothrix sp. (in: b-proteobacteria)]
MVIRSLYLSIYLTVVAVLLVFALIAGLLVHRHADAERGRIELAVTERTQAWARLIENSLPAADTPDEEQREALLDWGRRLQLAVALDTVDGRRIASTEMFDRIEADDPEGSQAVRVPLSDGRALWVLRPRMQRPPRGPRFGPPPQGSSGGPDWHVHGPERPPMGERPVLAGPAGWWQSLTGSPRAPRWLDEGGMLLLLLGVLFVAIAAGSYPIVRRLTRQLEALQRGVDRFGAGQLSLRVEAAGTDEVAALARSFNQAAQRIEDLVRSNRSLLANASHELRSPLARLKMAAAMSETATPEQRPALKAEIDRDIRELDALVDEVLLASRLDAQAGIASDPVDLLAICAEEAMHVGAALDVADSPTAEEGEPWQLRGDERLLRRALRNLLENACRYGGEAIELHLRADADRLSVAVCDRGPGVPLEERERIFEPFYRMPGHAERAGGVGLGLSLVRQIAARHGGDVGCEAREGGGSCFTLSLPLLARSVPHSG